MIPHSDIPLCSALAARRAGHELCLVAPGGKRPVERDWTTRESPTQAALRYHLGKLQFNYGLKLRRIIVFDADGPEGDDWLRSKGISSPMEVLTSKGRHLYLGLPKSLPEGFELRTRIRYLGLPLDFLTGETRMTLGPGSWVEKTETRYMLAAGKRLLGPDELPPCPMTALVASEFQRETEPMRARVREILVRPDDVLAHYAERTPVSEQGKNGSAACIRALLKFLTMTNGDEAKALEMACWWNQRCVPPWDTEAETGPDSLRKKLRDAAAMWRKTK